jgi:hypothetical protein
MKKLKRTILFLLIAFGLLGCKSAAKIEEIDFTSQFKQLKLDSTSKDTLGVKIDFCKIVGHNWDSIYIIPPYANTKFIDSIKANNLHEVDYKLEVSSVTEWAVHLVLIKDSKIISFGELSAGQLDLRQLVHPDQSFYMLTKKHCGKFFATFKKHYPDTWRIQRDSLDLIL